MRIRQVFLFFGILFDVFFSITIIVKLLQNYCEIIVKLYNDYITVIVYLYNRYCKII